MPVLLGSRCMTSMKHSRFDIFRESRSFQKFVRKKGGPKRQSEKIFLPLLETELLSSGMGGTEMGLYAQNPQTMCAKCRLSHWCFPGCIRVTHCCAHTPGWTNWFVPSGVHLERGHRYGMHTSPGGHRDTCPLHSQPRVNSSDLFTFILVFQRTGNANSKRVCLCLVHDTSALH